MEIGSTFYFGKYPQTKDGRKLPIEWRVLDVQNGKALIQSVYGLDTLPFDERKKVVTWDSCTLREWLAVDFYKKAFTFFEKNRIQITQIKAEKKPEYATDPGKDTIDKIFLLSTGEVEKYYRTYGERQCRQTEYVLSKSESLYDGFTEPGECYWWLRTPGEDSDSVASVPPWGWIMSMPASARITIRPALWINL